MKEKTIYFKSEIFIFFSEVRIKNSNNSAT